MSIDFETIWDFSDPELSESKFRALLDEATTDDDRAEALTQIARTYGLRRRFDEAHETLDQAAGLLSAGSKAEVRYMLERGRTINSSGGQVASRQVFYQAVDAARALGDGHLIVDAMHMVGIVEEPKTALKWNLDAIAFAESSDDPKAQKWLASLYNNTGWSLFSDSRYEEALELFERAHGVRKERDQVNEERIARWCVARCLRALGRNDEALSMQRQLLSDVGDRDQYVCEELAWLLQDSDPAAAKTHAQRALVTLGEDDYFAKYEADRLAFLKRLASDD